MKHEKMFSSKTIALALAILCSVQFQYGNGVMQEPVSFEKNLHFSGKKSFDNGNFVFAICDKNSPNTTQCNVVLQTYPNNVNNRSCPVTLKGDVEKSVLSLIVGVSTLGKDKAILFWEDDHDNSTTTKVATVQMETCKMNEVKIPDSSRQVIMDLHTADKMVTYDDDSFDIMIKDPERFEKKFGKLEINADGTAKGEATASTIRSTGLISYLSPIATHSSSKGYAFLNEDDKEYTLMLVKADGTEKHLKKYAKSTSPTVAVGDNVVSACTEANADSGVACSQYDENGDEKFTTTVSEKDKNAQLKAINNLPGGGILVLLTEPKPCDKVPKCKDDIKHLIVKIAPDGKIMGTAATGELDSTTNNWAPSYVYKNGDTEYCAAIVADYPINMERKARLYDILHQCVKESDFSV